MPVTITPKPAPAEDDFVGRPIMLPYALLCTHGERWCGWVRTANSQKDFVTHAADRRVHELSCKGGIVPATRMP